MDILTGPRIRFEGTKVKADNRRAKPTPSVGIHAYPVDEALSLEDGLLSPTLNGELSSGDAWETEVLLPHPYTFSLMKLFSFRDRLHDENKEFGRYHALDLYTILATTTEPEWDLALKLKEIHQKDPIVSEAKGRVDDYLSSGSMNITKNRCDAGYPSFLMMLLRCKQVLSLSDLNRRSIFDSN